MIRKDYSGRRYGKLTVLRFSHTKNKQNYWVCQCDCGGLKTVSSPHLTKGVCFSCGCHIKNYNSKTSRFYGIWKQMKSRCKNPKQAGYKNYGGKGITFCERWNDFENFQNDMEKSYRDHAEKHGERNTTLDRIDSEKGYNHENCRWATYREQRGNSSQTVFWSFRGEQKSTSELLEYFNPHDISYACFSSRVNNLGWDVEKSLSVPSNKKFNPISKREQLKANKVKPTQKQLGAISSTVRKQLHERSGGACERCDMQRATDAAHLIRRPHLTEKTTVNLLAHLCRGCHVFCDTTKAGRQWLEQFRERLQHE